MPRISDDPRAGLRRPSPSQVEQRLRDRIGLIVADPDLEQVAEQEQVAGAARVRVEPLEKQRGGARVVIAQVHVGANSGAPGDRAPLRRTGRSASGAADDFAIPVTDSIITGSAGTSRNGPTEPVRTLRIALTTSMPLTTLPNTA